MYLKNSKPFASLIKAIKYDIIILFIVSVLIGYFDNNLYLLQEFNLAIPGFIGTAIIVTLAFKTNKAYARWWEAKMIWEGIASNTRNWNRFVISTVFPVDNSMAHILIYRQLLWNEILKNRLRNRQNDLMNTELSPEEIAFLSDQDNLNQGILFLQGKSLMDEFDKKSINVFIHVQFEEMIKEFENLMGKAERIKNTVFPVSFKILLHFAIYFFCIISAYFISDNVVFFEASVSFVISVLFLGFLQISSELQDPFEDKPTDTPMNYICHQLNKETQQVLKDMDLITREEFTSTYIM
ncbi:bestrophin family protein [Marinigracilibium pacificum]|uniref:Bestrophin n=1 Tax=Marinigracilibium pacificum TaxID=2729599 RepID=A0A848IXB2_9BACT|nr:bestrophin family ion channel [Marinigracilibium pacificum]NMM47941.1 hypothetical protein [Marinigracilibium pacificum]